MVDYGDLRWVHGFAAAVDILTRPPFAAPRRRVFPGGDGETQCSKVRSDASPGRNKFAEPSSDRAMRLTHRWSTR
jgi:hypothetical protein